jgi:2-polyprenyl-3-methyl-5-hydroxy-6-metoxy-1,4-benzoquinol methylase
METSRRCPVCLVARSYYCIFAEGHQLLTCSECGSRGRIRQLTKYARRGRFLDVGCNGGFMVEAPREAGFDAVGLDIDSVAIGYAQKHYREKQSFSGMVEAFSEKISGHFDPAFQ